MPFLLQCMVYFVSKEERLFTYVLILLGFGLSAIQIIPGIELMGVSARANHSYIQMMKANLIQPWQTLMLFFPNLFGNPVSRTYWLSDTYVGKVTSIGLVPLFFTFGNTSLESQNSTIFIIATLVIGIFITVNPFTSFLYLFPLPFISSSNPTLMVFYFLFVLQH